MAEETQLVKQIFAVRPVNKRGPLTGIRYALYTVRDPKRASLGEWDTEEEANFHVAMYNQAGNMAAKVRHAAEKAWEEHLKNKETKPMEEETNLPEMMFQEETAHVEWWDPFDPRLPEKIDRPEGKDFKAYCDNFKKGQLQPIVVGRWPDAFGPDEDPYLYELGAGRKRILAARKLNKKVWVAILDVRGPGDIINLRFSENFFRSDNEAADVLAMRKALLFENKTYSQIPGLTKHEAERLDRKWGNVPVEFIQAAADGTCSISTALEAGRLKGKSRKKALKGLSDAQGDGRRFAANDIKEIRSAVKGEAVGTLNWLGTGTQQRASFDRMEIETVRDYLKARKYDKALEFTNALLQ